MKKLRNWLKSKKDKLAVAALAFTLTTMASSGMGMYATEASTSGIQLNFDPATMFGWTQMILDVMMPVLYITLGISLAFIIIRALKAAFA